MRRNFLLDENMVFGGLRGRQRAVPDIWLMIGRNGHQITVSPELYSKYWEKLRRPRRSALFEIAARLTGIINQMLRDSEKSIWVVPESPSPLRRYVRHMKDYFLADIADTVISTQRASDCTLVTTDRRTREDFSHPQMQQLGITGVTIERGLRLASQSCSGSSGSS